MKANPCPTITNMHNSAGTCALTINILKCVHGNHGHGHYRYICHRNEHGNHYHYALVDHGNGNHYQPQHNKCYHRVNNKCHANVGTDTDCDLSNEPNNNDDDTSNGSNGREHSSSTTSSSSSNSSGSNNSNNRNCFSNLSHGDSYSPAGTICTSQSYP